MDAFTRAVDYLAAPPRLFALALVTFLACRGSKVPWSRAFGWVLLGLTAGFLGAGLTDATFRGLLLHPERLPVVILVLASVAVLWTEMRRFHLAGAPAERPGLTVTTADAVVATAVGCGLVLLAWWLPAPLGPEADPVTPPELVKTPWFFGGLQELATYFDPWVPYLALPLLLVAGLLGLPYFEVGDEGGGRRRSLFLLGWLLLWLWPMTVAALLRGPQWLAFGPFEAWDPARPLPPTPRPLSEMVWVVWLRGAEPAPWWQRELPGMLLLAAYFVLLPLALRHWRVTRGAFNSYRKTMGPWRFRVALAWVLAVMIVPLKMYGQWLLDVGPWIHLPEISFNF